jgi:hypothetical protein
MESRGAVFTDQPQVVEVYQAGAWWPGELLGWRHDDAGVCQVWVRVIVGGVEEAAWTALDTLRLPQPAPVVPSVSAATAPQATQTLAAAEAVSALRQGGAAHGAETTVSLPLVRDHVRASSAARSGGRRRAPEDGDVEVARASSVPVPPSGRHRAPAQGETAFPGRHRAADTGLFPAVGAAPAEAPAATREELPPTAAWSVPMARTTPAGETTPVAGGWTAPAGLDAHLLTRPMRLSDQVPHARRPRVNGSLSGA